MTGRHDTVGADLVNHCVNDILVQGAQPLFFLDYLATGRLSPDVAEQVVAGVARGVPRERLRAARRRDRGDARASTPTANTTSPASSSASWIANGSSMAETHRAGRRADWRCRPPGCTRTATRWRGACCSTSAAAAGHGRARTSGDRVGDALLAPHRSYLNSIRPLLDAGLVKGLAHITGGGITENLPRVLPEGAPPRSTRRRGPCPPFFVSFSSAAALRPTRCSARSTWASA